MDDEHKGSSGEEAGEIKTSDTAAPSLAFRLVLAGGEGMGSILYWASGLWLIFGIWAWVHPKSLQKLLGPDYRIVYPGREKQ